MSRYLLLLLIPMGAFGFWFYSGPQSALITVDPEQEFQRMSGWEVTLRLWETNKSEDRFDNSWERHGDEIFDRLVNELGVNRVRLEVKSGIENPVDYWALFERGDIGYLKYKSHYYEKINDNDDPGVLNPDGIKFSMLDYQVEKMLLPIKQLVEANGEKLLINLCYVDFKGSGPQGTLSHATAPEEYAELIAATVEHLSERFGVVPDALEIVLEPDNSAQWRGEQIGNGLMAVSSRLESIGVTPNFVAPSTAHANRAPGYFDEMISVPGVLDTLDTLAYHRYDPVPDFITLPRIRNRAEKYGLETAMLEGLDAGARDLYADLTKTNITAWQQYGIAVQLSENVILRQGYYYGLATDKHGNRKIVLSESARELLQYFKYIRHGAVRIGTKSSSNSQRAVAFRNKNGSNVVVIRSLRSASLEIENLPEGTYSVSYTTDQVLNAPLAENVTIVGENLHLSMPEPGILTIYQM